MEKQVQPTTLDYGALCIDTCVYESLGLTFGKGLLKQLEQFSESPVSLLVPEVVHFELEKHLTQRVHDARTKVARALRIATDELGVAENTVKEVQQLLLGNSDEKLGPKWLEAFYKRTNAQIVSSAGARMGRLVQMYFSAYPPFEASGNKKAEFPDAIALLSLEEWATANDCNVLVVSTDGGWRDFCDGSPRLDLFDDLGSALAHFQPHHIAATLIQELRIQIVRGEPSEILNDIRAEIEQAVERQVVLAEATSSSYYLDEHYVEATYLSHEFRCDSNDEPEINLVYVWSEGLVLQLRVIVSCEITGEYGLSVRDPVDRDYVPLGKTKVSSTGSFAADVVVTLIGDFGNGIAGVQVDEVEVEGSLGYVEFGEIDPDPQNDEWDREKFA